MLRILRRPLSRWLVPAAVAVAVLGGSAAIRLVAASAADPDLPPRSAAQLLVDLQTARLDGLSGTVVARADLGLPALPAITGRGGRADLTSLLSGTHTLRVWYAGPSSARVALLSPLGESDVITNGRDVWVWSSRENTATHRTLPAHEEANAPLDPGALPFTPQQAADAALAAIDPSTVVTRHGSRETRMCPAWRYAARSDPAGGNADHPCGAPAGADTTALPAGDLASAPAALRRSTLTEALQRGVPSRCTAA